MCCPALDCTGCDAGCVEVDVVLGVCLVLSFYALLMQGGHAQLCCFRTGRAANGHHPLVSVCTTSLFVHGWQKLACCWGLACSKTGPGVDGDPLAVIMRGAALALAHH
jgi:hypothetical protein